MTCTTKKVIRYRRVKGLTIGIYILKGRIIILAGNFKL